MYVACTMSTVHDCMHTTPAYNYTTTKSPFHARSSPSRARYLRARKWRCHSVTFAHGNIAMSLSRVRRHHDVTFAHAETSRCHFHAHGDIAMSLSLRAYNVTFARDSQCHFHEGFAKLREYIANSFLHPTVDFHACMSVVQRGIKYTASFVPLKLLITKHIFSLWNSPGKASKVVCPYSAGTEVLNGSLNGTAPEDCGGRTYVGYW